MAECDQGVCTPQGLCLLQQQLMAQSILGFGNMVTINHNQDLEYLKSTQIVTMAAIGKSVPQVITAP